MLAIEEESPRTLIDVLLEEQRSLTAIDRFSRKHSASQLPAQSRYYKDLIPLTKPGAGEQYAFAVDLDKCTGCKACVSACHSLNGLDDDEVWRNVGMVVGGTVREPYQQTITTACHHCVEPGCLIGCPVAAYEKDPETGIVRHLDDQCIGCQYCILKCPYDVPKYSETRGIVRKCDMCYNRLSVGEAPACVQACPTEAISIRFVTKAEITLAAQPKSRLIPGAFESSYTKPTTSYSSKRSAPANAHPGDQSSLRLEHPHWPLIWMLLLTQGGAGVFVTLAFATLSHAEAFATLFVPMAFAGVALLHAGLAVSILHLGKPLKAWRFFLGLKTSWMSREILAFSVFSAASFGSLVVAFCNPNQAFGLSSLLQPVLKVVGPNIVAQVAGLTMPVITLTALFAIVAVYCSAMIYVDTHRPFWARRPTLLRFFGTSLLLGLATTSLLLTFTRDAKPEASLLACGIASIAWLSKIYFHTWELRIQRADLYDPAAKAHRSARIIKTMQPRHWQLRHMLIALGLVTGVFAIFGIHQIRLAAVVAFLLFSAGAALIERYCFFTASDGPRMPGGIAS